MLARLGIVSLLALLLGVGSAQAQQATFTISGTSTVRNWSCPATGTVKVTPGKTAKAVPGFPNGVQSATVTIPVKSITCPEDLMIQHVNEALKSAQFPEMTYTMTGYSLGERGAVNVTGTLKIYAITKPLNFPARIEGGHLTGEAPIDLAIWTVPPPVLFGGLLKVSKDITVKLDVPLQP